jgi:hypothetical protein
VSGPVLGGTAGPGRPRRRPGPMRRGRGDIIFSERRPPAAGSRGRGRRGGQYESSWRTGLWSGAFLTLTIAQDSGVVTPKLGGLTLTMGAGVRRVGWGSGGPLGHPRPELTLPLLTVGGLWTRCGKQSGQLVAFLPVGGLWTGDVVGIPAVGGFSDRWWLPGPVGRQRCRWAASLGQAVRGP